MAAATQYANKAPKQSEAPKASKMREKRSGIKEKLHALPMAAGVAAMALLLVLSLFVGNFRALQRATPNAFYWQGDVEYIVEQRIAQAGNAVTVAKRAGLNDQLILDVMNAINGMEAARTAREISRADQQLTAAVSELTTAPLSGEEAKNMLRAADNFAEQGSFLKQEAREFNRRAEKAEKLYASLPTKFLLTQPDVYEGI